MGERPRVHRARRRRRWQFFGYDGLGCWCVAAFFAAIGLLQLPLLALGQVTPQEVPGNLGFMLLIASPFVVMAWFFQGFVVRRQGPEPSSRVPAPRAEDAPSPRVQDAPAQRVQDA